MEMLRHSHNIPIGESDTARMGLTDKNQEVNQTVTRRDFDDVEAENFRFVYNIQSEYADKLNVKLNVHSYDPLSDEYQEYIRKNLEATADEFQHKFSPTMHQYFAGRELNIFVFENNEHFFKTLRDLGDNSTPGGKAWPSLGKIYVYKQGNKILNLSHEMSHYLFYHATAGQISRLDGATLLDEGVGDYIQHLVEHGNTIDFDLMSSVTNVSRMFDKHEEMKKLDLAQIVGIIKDHAGDEQYNALKYELGIALVHFMEERYPNLLDETFRGVVPVEVGDVESLAQGVGKISTYGVDSINKIVHFQDYAEEFLRWLKDNGLDSFATNHNLLSVEKGEAIGDFKGLSSVGLQDIKIFSADIKDASGNIVGNFSPVQHYSLEHCHRIYNAVSKDFISIDPQYQYLKLEQVAGEPGKYAYVYCNSAGEPYYQSAFYNDIDNAGRILQKYYPQFDAILQACSKVQEQYAKCVPGGPLQDVEQAIIDAMRVVPGLGDKLLNYMKKYNNDTHVVDVGEKVWVVRDAYFDNVSRKVSNILNMVEHEPNSASVRKILADLTYIDPQRIRNASGVDFQKFAAEHAGAMLSVKALGQGDVSGLSVYLGDKKLGELPSESGNFREYADGDETVTEFVVNDALKGVFTTYNDEVLMAVMENQQGEKELSFIRNTIDHESGVIIIEANPFLQPSMLNLTQTVELSKGVRPANYEHLEGDRGMPDATMIRKGVLRDDKGTERLDDDSHEAVVQRGEDIIIQKLNSLSFYITEERTDDSGEVFDKSNFFISDSVTGKRFQLPDTITHLMLIKTDSGIVRLLPCTEDGNPHPADMPGNMDGYEYIDPIFVHQYIVDEVSKKTQLNLVDFGKYASGTMFRMQYDPEDSSIRRDSNGDILRRDDQSYMTKVRIIHDEDGEVGKLCNALTKFQGDILLSFDLSYSYSDFISSLHSRKVNVEDQGDSVYLVTMTGDNDLGTDVGYSNYFAFQNRARQDDQALEDEVKQKIAEASSLYRDKHSKESASREDGYSQDGAHRGSHVVGDDVKQESHQQDVVHGNRYVGDTVVPNSHDFVDVQARALHSNETKVPDDVANKLSHTMFYVIPDQVVDDQVASGQALFIYDTATGSVFQFPESITHLKLVTHDGKKQFVPCTSDGEENPIGMPENLGENRWIDNIFLHSGLEVHESQNGRSIDILLPNLDAYVEGTLFRMGHKDTGTGYNYEQVRIFHEEHGEIGALSLDMRQFHADEVHVKIAPPADGLEGNSNILLSGHSGVHVSEEQPQWSAAAYYGASAAVSRMHGAEYIAHQHLDSQPRCVYESSRLYPEQPLQDFAHQRCMLVESSHNDGLLPL